ncbi:MAG TPA: cytochrome c maturation protein CcmE [Gaiellaceae bacterium]
MTTRSPARLIVALAVATVLAIFLLYTAIAGKSTPQLSPSQLRSHPGVASVVGVVVGPVAGDSHTARGLRFGLRDRGTSNGVVVPVVYHGDSPPPLFRATREVVVTGRYANGRIDGTGIVTKCPSKYTASSPKA